MDISLKQKYPKILPLIVEYKIFNVKFDHNWNLIVKFLPLIGEYQLCNVKFDHNCNNCYCL